MADILGIASAVGNVISQGMANYSNQKINEQNREHELTLMRLQNQYATQQANAADERTRQLYMDLQSPEAMRQQLENAGLSVGLMYGSGGMGGQMQSGAQGEAPSIPNRGTIPMSPIMDAQTAAILANANKLEAETKNINEDTKKKEAETASTWKDLPIKEKQLIVMDNSIEKLQSEIKVNNKNLEVMAEDIKNKLADTDLKNSQKELTEAQKKVQEALEEYQRAMAGIAKIDLSVHKEWTKAQIDEMQANARQANAAAENFKAMAKKAGVETDVLEKSKYAIIKENFMKAAMAEMEKNTFMKGKQLEWAKAEQEIDKILEEVKTDKTRNHAYERCKEIFGENALVYLKMSMHDILY